MRLPPRPPSMLVLTLLLAITWASPTAAQACTKSWASAVTGSWTTASLWSPAGVPGPSDDVCITVDGTYRVTVPTSQTVNTVTVGLEGNAGIQTLAINGGGGVSTTLTVASGVMNAGVVLLQTVGTTGNGVASNLVVTAGGLTNTGTLQTLNDAQSTPRLVAADLLNTGTVLIAAATFFNKAGATYENRGTFTINASRALTIQNAVGQTEGQTFRQADGTLTVNGTMAVTGHTFEFTGGTMIGQPVVNSGTLRFGPGAAGTGDFSLRGVSSLAGDIPSGHIVRVNGAGPTPATVTAATGFTNAGILEIQSLNLSGFNNGVFSTLAVTTGTLTNTGTLRTLTDSLGNARGIAADLLNTGSVQLGATTTFNKPNGVYENRGTLTIATSRSLVLANTAAGQTFRQADGTLGVNGTMAVNGQTFEFTGGTVIGQAVVNSGTLRFGPGAAGTGDFSLRGVSTLAGDIPAGHIVRVNGAGPTPATVTAATGFTNAGILEIQSLSLSGFNNGVFSTLAVTTGTLTNTGTLRTLSDVFSTGRTLAANLLNRGTVELGTNLTFAKTNGVYVNDNLLALGTHTLTINGINQSFTTTGQITGGGSLNLTNIAMFASGTVAANLNLTSVDTHVGPSGAGLLDVTGNYRMITGGTLNIQLGGLTPGTGYDRINVSGTATLLGTLAVTTTNGFCPTGAFTPMTYGARVGDFATKTGLDLGDGRVLTATPGATSYVLSAPATCNTAPVVTVNAGLTLDEGTTAGIGAALLSVTDAEQTPAQITFTVTTLPVRGTVRRAGAVLALNGTFSQADVNGGLVSYAHDGSETTADAFAFRASDGSSLPVGPATFAITVNPVNDAPILDAGVVMALGAILEDDPGGPGTLVATILGTGAGGAPIADPDPGAVPGIAVTAADSANGAWQFSTDAGATWAPLGAPAVASARLLTDTARLRFVPNADFNGMPSIGFRAWDRMTGVAGAVADTGTNGGTTAFSTTIGSARITVTAVNDAPRFTRGADESAAEDGGTQSVAGWATAINAGPTDESGQTRTFLVTADNAELFTAGPAVASDGTLTYTPAADANGAAVVTVRLRDDGGTADGGVDISAPQTFTITVRAVNDVPSFVKGADEIVQEDAGPRTVAAWATAISPGPADEAAQLLTFDVTTDNAELFAAPPAIAADGTLTYTLAADANGIAQVTVRVRDDGGTTDGGVDTSEPQTFGITVAAVNDPPVIAALTAQRSTTGETITLAVGATDVEDDALVYAAAGLPPGLSIDPETGVISGTIAVDGAGTYTVDVTVTDGPGESSVHTFTWVVESGVREACVVVDFREITYFRGGKVLTSSDAGIRAKNRIGAAFGPALWPAGASRPTLFRIYGFAASELGVMVPDADDPARAYPVLADEDVPGAYYIDLGGPARAEICLGQLQMAVIDGSSPAAPGTLPDSVVLAAEQRDVAGLMLARNASVLPIPLRVRDELHALGTPLVDADGMESSVGVVDYIAVQLFGDGNASHREFVDVEVRVITDDPADRATHYATGFHTAARGTLETPPGCSYVDHAPGNDGLRLNDVWEGTHAGHRDWGAACGSREQSVNQKRRENYAVPLDGVQILSTVNSDDDTMRIYLGTIRVP